MAINADPGDRGNSVDYIKDTYLLCQREGIDDENLKAKVIESVQNNKDNLRELKSIEINLLNITS